MSGLMRSSKGEKVTAKAHGGQIDIQGVTVASVDDKVRLQSVETWMDSLEMFRQIAPGGIVNKEPMNGDSKENDTLGHEHGTDGSAHNEPSAPIAAANTEQTATPQEHNSMSTDPPAAASMPSQSPALGIDEATVSAAETSTSHPLSNHPTAPSAQSDPQPGLHPSGPVSAAEPFHDVKMPATHDAVDQMLERPAEEVHPHPKDVEAAVGPAPGEAVAAPARSEEVAATHREMSEMSPAECPFLMNRE